MQVIEDKQQKQRRSKRKRKRGAVAGLATLHANDPSIGEDDPSDPPPLFVCFDIEARQDQGEQVANLLCAEREDNDQCKVFEGETCLEEFLDWLRAQNPNQRPPTCSAK